MRRVLPARGADEVEARRRVRSLPFAQFVDDVFHLLDLVTHALAGVDVGDVDDGLFVGVEDLEDIVGVGPGVKVVAKVERFEVLVAVELFVVGVGDGLEFRLVFRHQYRHGVAAEVGAGHGHDVRLVPLDEFPELAAEYVVAVGADVVELVDGDQAVVKGLHAEPLHGKAEGGVGADQRLIVAFQEGLHRLHLAAVFPRRVAEVPAGLHRPVVERSRISSAARRRNWNRSTSPARR